MRAQGLVARFVKGVLPEHDFLTHTRRFFAPMERELTRLARLTDPKQLYYYCPCQVE